MIRTQIQLTEPQSQALKQLAGQRGVSVAELIRQGAEYVLKEGDQREKRWRALEAIGKFPGPADLSTDHDGYLAEDRR